MKTWDQFLAEFKSRHVGWFEGNTGPRKAASVAITGPVEPPRDFKKAAGGEEDWDGFEG